MSNEAALSDYIGTLVTEIAQARMQVDVEAKRMALLYKKDPILQHFPIPRFRIPEMEIETSVIIGSIDRGTKDDDVVNKSIDFSSLKKTVVSRLKKSLLAKNLDMKKVEQNLNKLIRGFSEATTVQEVSQGFQSAVLSAWKKEQVTASLQGRRETNKQKRTRSIISDEVNRFMRVQPAIGVYALSSDVREHARDEQSQGSLVKIKMKLTEEAFQWTVVEDDDPESDEYEEILVPE